MPSGAYALQVTATDRATQLQASQSITFEIE
jgi:hypothetical protein